jgi:hypothetical protein
MTPSKMANKLRGECSYHTPIRVVLSTKKLSKLRVHPRNHATSSKFRPSRSYKMERLRIGLSCTTKRFCYVIFNSHMLNAPRFNSEKDVSLKILLL